MFAKLDNITRNMEITRYIKNAHYKEFNEAVKSACNTQEALNLFGYLRNIGLIYGKKGNECPEFIPDDDLPLPIEERKEKLANVMKDLYAVTDFKRIKHYQEYKLKSSPTFKEFYDAFHSEEAQNLFKKFYANPQVNKLNKLFEKYGMLVLEQQSFLNQINTLLI